MLASPRGPYASRKDTCLPTGTAHPQNCVCPPAEGVLMVEEEAPGKSHVPHSPGRVRREGRHLPASALDLTPHSGLLLLSH